MDFDKTSNKVIGCAIEVHRHLGPGLMESAYEQCLARELSLAGLIFEMQKSLPVAYKGIQLDCGYRMDFLIEGHLIVELKAASTLLAIHEAQILTYMKLAGASIGLLIKFNVEILKQGIRRLVL